MVEALLADPRFLDALPGYLLPDEANQAASRSSWGNCARSAGSSQFLDLERNAASRDVSSDPLCCPWQVFSASLTVRFVVVHSGSLISMQ